MWHHEITGGCENELLIKALKLFVEDKIDQETLKIMLRDVFEINVARINTKLFDEVGPSANTSLMTFRSGFMEGGDR